MTRSKTSSIGAEKVEYGDRKRMKKESDTDRK
uniref:Uncharacterized protein n=1 Tax=Steinernema glaseri TaxID=37863 RepID=A0A1I8AC28_9BILA